MRKSPIANRSSGRETARGAALADPVILNYQLPKWHRLRGAGCFGIGSPGVSQAQPPAIIW